MIGRGGRVSLYLTLGVAAIDLLSCAFVSSVLLFIMFLLPQQASGVGISGSEHHLILHWAISSLNSSSPNSTVLGIELEPPSGKPAMIWSDQKDSVLNVCASLSIATDVTNACHVVFAEDNRNPDGMSIVEELDNGGLDGYRIADFKSCRVPSQKQQQQRGIRSRVSPSNQT
jgi:hypothetical protein